MGTFAQSAAALRSSASRIPQTLAMYLSVAAETKTQELKAGMRPGHLFDTGELAGSVGTERPEELQIIIGMGPRLSDRGVDLAPLAETGSGAWPLGGSDRHMPIGYEGAPTIIGEAIKRTWEAFKPAAVAVMEAEGSTYGG